MTELVQLGIAGRMARAWIHSKLTPLVIISSLLLGGFAIFMLPREEEPQIIVPMIDVMVAMPGASAQEVEQRVTRPMEKLLWEIPGVEYVYSTTQPGAAMVIVRFKVGEDEERSIVKLNQKMFANFDLIPPGASEPLIKPRSIDDVPILALTLHSRRYNDLELRRLAAELHDSIKQVSDVSEVTLLGGQRRELRVTLDAARLSGYRLSPLQVLGALGQSNQQLPAGRAVAGNRETVLEAGGWLRNADDARNLVVAVADGRPVYLRDVSTVEDAGEEPVQYVQFASGRRFEPAVTISVAKRKGTNAIHVADQVLAKVDALKGRLIPADVELTITRNYGETAAEKSNELLFHMGIAVVSVSLLIALVLGIRESLIVFTAIPVTLALTLSVFYFYGYTLNRITLFALIFSIGILVDDAIVVVENIVRHARMAHNAGRSLAEVAVEAVDEVGNPTILATLTVIAAILPMAFVGGLMGPYMRPIPIGSTAAIIFSLLVAFMVTPWAAVRILKPGQGHGHDGAEDRMTLLYRRVMDRLLHVAPLRYGFLLTVTVLLVGAMGLVYIEFVKVKMLPFDNKSEFQVIVDMPEGTTLEETAHVTRELAEATFAQSEVVNVQTYVGTASPYNFNGLVRHYFLRRGSNVADIQVNLLGKGERSLKSHEIAKQVRERLRPIALAHHARMKVAEVPPGPPVLQTLVAEVYGPQAEGPHPPGAADPRHFRPHPRRSRRRLVRGGSAAARDLAHRPRKGGPERSLHRRHRQDHHGGLRRRAGGPAACLRGQGRRPRHRAPGPRHAQRPRTAQEPESGRPRGQPGAGRRAGAGGEDAPGAEHLPQEPDAGHLRHRRHRRRDGEPGVRHSQARPGDLEAAGGGRLRGRAVHCATALRRRPLRHEVGRRVAHHLRGVSRSRHRLRRGAGADLRAGGGLV